jgi:hypothetical protein
MVTITQLEKFLENNHSNYIKDNYKLGFTDVFPEDTTKTIDTILFEHKGHKVEVRLTKLNFGVDKKFSVTGIVTDNLEIKRTEPLNGFGQHGYMAECEIMKLAALEMLKKHNLMVNTNICTWPFVKLVVSEPTEKHFKY